METGPATVHLLFFNAKVIICRITLAMFAKAGHISSSQGLSGWQAGAGFVRIMDCRHHAGSLFQQFALAAGLTAEVGLPPWTKQIRLWETKFRLISACLLLFYECVWLPISAQIAPILATMMA